MKQPTDRENTALSITAKFYHKKDTIADNALPSIGTVKQVVYMKGLKSVFLIPL